MSLPIVSLKPLCALPTSPRVHTWSKAPTARAGIAAPEPGIAARPRQPPLPARCPHSPSLSTWSSSLCPLRSTLAVPGSTEAVTAPRHSSLAAALPAPWPPALLPRQGSARALAASCRPREGTAARGRQRPRGQAGLQGPGPGSRCRGSSRGWGRAAAGRGGAPGSWLTHEPDGRLSQGLLRALHERQGLVQALGRSAPVLCQLQRAPGGKGWRGSAPWPGSLPSPGLPCPHGPEARPAAAGAGLRRGPRAGCCPGSRGAAPRHGPARPGLHGHPARGHRSLEKSPGKGAACGAQAGAPGAALGRGTAASPTHWAPGAGGFSRLSLGFQVILTRHSANFDSCSFFTSCPRFLLFRNLAAQISISREAWRAAETRRWHHSPGHRTRVPVPRPGEGCSLRGLRAGGS